MIHHGLDAGFFRPGPVETARPYVLFVGSMGPAKNLARVLLAFHLLHRRVPHDLLLVGPTAETVRRDPAVRKCLSLLPADRVRFRRDLSAEQLRDAYRGADAFVLPSIHEGFGYPPLEAMACGTPVVVSDLPIFRETVGDAGLFVVPRSAVSIAVALEKLLGDADLRTRMAESGLRRAKHFDAQRCVHRTMDVIAQAVARRGAFCPRNRAALG